jgi:type I restriction enzyme, S subunit
MMAILRPYPEYKQSRLPWLGTIPAHWEEKRAKYLFREVDERSTSGQEELLSVSHVTGVTPRRQKNVTMFMAESYVGHKLCRPGDLVINTMWAWMAALGVAKEPGLVSPSYHVYRPRTPSALHPEFADHLLRTRPYASEYNCRSTGIRGSRLRLYPEEFLDIPIVCPPEEDQRRILSFVNVRDRAIRRYIRTKRRLIELLNEQKQAVISRAVHRGLDPSAAVKSSGIDWLGDVPAHWQTRRLKYLLRNVNEQVSAKSPGERYVALEHIESWTGKIRPPSEDVEFDSQVKRFKPGDILFGKLRPYLAKVCLPAESGVCVGELLVLRPTAEDLLPEFLERKLRSREVIDLVNSSTYGAKMPRAEWTFIGNVLISYPPPEEQRQILCALRKDTAGLDEAIARAQGEIEVMLEYRTRLIADAVTGRLDVRHLQPEEGEAPLDGLVPSDLLADVLEGDELADAEALPSAEEGDGADD